MKFLLVLITAFFTVSAGAQHSSSPEGHINIGIKGGVNIFNVYDDNSAK